MLDHDEGSSKDFKAVLSSALSNITPLGEDGDIERRNKKGTSLWLIDAETASHEQSAFSNYITTTPSIKGYLEDTSEQWGISAVKGIGKTFLMQVKRRRIADKCICLPPEKNGSNSNWGMEALIFSSSQVLSNLTDFDALVLMWKFAILCYVINHMRGKENVADSLKRVKLSNITRGYCTINTYRSLNALINNLLSIKNWKSIINADYIGLLGIGCDIKEYLKENYIVVFIDRLDQALSKVTAEQPSDCVDCPNNQRYSRCSNPKKSEEFCKSVRVENICSDRDNCCYGCEIFTSEYSNCYLRVLKDYKGKFSYVNIWQYIQLSLVAAAYQIKKEYDSKIRTYYSIREESLYCQYDVLGDDRRKISVMLLRLHYTIDEHKEIFNTYIKKQGSDFLFDYQKAAKSPEYAFVGASQICHPYVENAQEELFYCIYRHTYDRTRDIQQFGRDLTDNLSEIKKLEEDDRKQKIKGIIEQTAAALTFKANDTALTETYFVEKSKLLPTYWRNNENFEAFIKQIDRNLLLARDIKKICQKINKKDSQSCQECSDCQHHPFSMLYLLGMLGYIVPSRSFRTVCEQKFIDSKDVTYFVEKDQLSIDDKTLYIIHPALTKSIELLRKNNIKHFCGFILGKCYSVPGEKIVDIIEDAQDCSEVGISSFLEKYYK